MSKQILLFCFPFVGGTANFYNKLESCVPDNIKFIKLEYSGHGNRMKEPLYASFDDMVEDLYPVIFNTLEQYQEYEYGLFGYSMGSISAFVILQKIMSENSCRKPEYIFLAAHTPGRITNLFTLSSDETDENIKERTIQFGGVPEKLLNNQSFWRMYLPMYKADYKMLAEYDFEVINFQSCISATIFYSEEDTKYEDMIGWKKFFVGKCEYIKYDGTHFFINKYYQEMAKIICNRLEN